MPLPRPRPARAALLAVVAAGVAAAIAATSDGRPAAPVMRWQPLLSTDHPADLAGPRRDGRLVLSTHTGLALLGPDGTAVPFGRGPSGWAGQVGEPYVAVVPATPPKGATMCPFTPDDVFVLDPGPSHGVVRVTASGEARRVAELPPGALPSGIAFDTGGRFGGRLLVVSTTDEGSALIALDCAGRATTLTDGLPRVEGGVAIAPAGLGRFGGDLLAADERTGVLWAIGPTGTARVVARTSLPVGKDVGIESIGVVPARPGPLRAYLADLGAPGAPTEWTNTVLTLGPRQLARIGVRPGDLLVATEAGGRTLLVRCAPRCTTRLVAIASPATHAEGHIAFLPAR